MVRRVRRSMAGSSIKSQFCACSRVDSSGFSVGAMAKWRVKKRALYAAIVVLCMLPVQQVTLAYEMAATYDEASVAVGRSAHEPRFGERLLPLRKKSGSIMRMGVAAGAFPLAGASSAERSVNQLHKSNYVVARAEPSAKVKGAQKRTNVDELYVSTLDDVHELAVASTSPAAAASALTIPFSAQARQAKQLHRREDTDIGDMLEHAAHTANISKADRLVEMSTEFFIVPSSSTTHAPQHASAAALPPRMAPKSRGVPAHVQPPSVLMAPAGSPPRSVLIVAPKSTGGVNSSVTPPTIVSTHLNFTGLRKEPWVVPVLVLASLTMLMMGAFEIFVLFKAWRTSPSRRHLFLGQMLLLGLFACAGLGAIITAQPSLLSCGTIRFGVGVAYALVFAALLVKCVFLISLNGGVYLPAPYQGLLLLFAVLIQVAIGAQWLLTQPPEIYTLNVPILGSGLLASTLASNSASSSSAAANFAATFFHPSTHGSGDLYARISAAGTVLIPLCKTQFSELLFSLIYIVFLIVFVAVLAIKSRGIRDNYREATYIGLAIGGAIPIWLGWMFVGLAVAERHKDACIAFGLVATSATVFLVMFMPKGRQLAAMGKEGLYVEDREEQFSSLSRAGSGYSPSFFHFKPIKYGVMSGGMQNSASNTGNGASSKHCSNGMSGGDRVALVTAAPPSYTRMYHYFPAHLTTHPFCFYPQPPPPPPPLTQLPSPPTLKQMGNSLTSMTHAHIAQTLRYPGLFIRPDETNLYTTLEPTLSSNPNVYFQRGGAVHPGMMY